MRPALYTLLADPDGGRPLRLEAVESEGDDVITGMLRREDGAEYSIRCGIPRLVVAPEEGQAQTGKAFEFKWKKRDTYGSRAAQSNAIRWYVEKYGFESHAEWVMYFAGRRAILDAGCGSGFSASLWLDSPSWNGQAMWVGADISDAIDVARERLRHIANTHFVQADIMRLPFRGGSFDTIFSEGVLHHTPSTRAALLAVAGALAPKGELHFYVYRRKGPVREFSDDHVRAAIAQLSDEEAWSAMRSLAHLGQVLAEAGATVEVREEVPLLGIKAGKHDVQRLIYEHFAKLYWNPALSFEENVHVYFDWYRPRYAHRQTAEHVREWCEEANLSIQWFHEEVSGFTVRARKR